MPISWDKNPAARPLLSIFAGTTCYCWFDDNRLLIWNEAAQTFQPGVIPNPIKRFDRVIFHDPSQRQGQAYLVGFNVVSGIGTQVDFGPQSLTLRTAIRCFFQSGLAFQSRDGRISIVADADLCEAIVLEAHFDSERITYFRLSHTSRKPFEGVDLLAGITAPPRRILSEALAACARTPIRLAASNQDDIRTLQGHLIGGLIALDPGENALEGGSSSEDLLNALGREPASLGVTFFQTSDSNGNFSGYVVQFEAGFNNVDVDEKILCFAVKRQIDQDRSANFPVARGTWYFRQRGNALSCVPGSRSDLQNKAPGEWILELSCVSQAGVANQMHRWTRAGDNGIRAYAGATGASFLPDLIPPPANSGGIVFAAIYQIADRTSDCLYRGAKLGKVADAKATETAITVEPWSVQFVENESPRQLALFFPLCDTTTATRLTAIQWIAPAPFVLREKWRGFAFYSRYALEMPRAQNVRTGSLELMFGISRVAPGPPQTPFQIRMEDLGNGGQLQIEGALFNVSRILPGGQDDLPEDTYLAPNTVVEQMACRAGSFSPDAHQPPLDLSSAVSQTQADGAVEQAFYRPRPLLVNPVTPTGDEGLTLTVNESSGPGRNRTLRMSVDVGAARNTAGTAAQSVIVLDSDPFLVAKVSFPSLLSQAGAIHLATWDNTAPDGAKWQIPITQSAFSLTFPAQTMGEEMVKDRNLQLPADFRLSPPATVAMTSVNTPPTDNGTQSTNYAEVPWNLRRILGYAGQTDPGVTVNRLDYELLYGLSCDVSQPFVKLAETFSLLGAIPVRLPWTLAVPNDPSLSNSALQKWRVEWAMLHRRYQSRLAILETWDSHVSGSLTLKHGMSCVIRYNITDSTRQACSENLLNRGFSFPADQFSGNIPYSLQAADLEDPISPPQRVPGAPRADSDLLRGGVTWGFESRNIFCAVLRNEYSTTDSAAVSDLALTALGASGHQQTSFDEGRTSVFADSAMGRTYYYKLERIGRIGVFWNKAKHVIVYERSVVPSRQFYQEQNPAGGPVPPVTYGIPLLRKVDEYVEIIQDERRFPDDNLISSTGAGTFAGTPAQRCGFVASCIFPKGVKIRVSSSWGSDVNTYNAAGTLVPIGWKIPLWKRGALPADVYPFPKASLSVLSEFAGASKESPCDIANPENLYFYTDTQEGTGSDSDKWGSLVGIDTVDVDMKLRKPASISPNANPAVPPTGDVPIPAGFSPCTFSLLPALRPANVVANRAATPMAANLASVTMMRGFVRPSGQTDPFPKPASDLIQTYRDQWDSVLKGATAASWTLAQAQAWGAAVTGAIKVPIHGDQQTQTRGLLDLAKAGWINVQQNLIDTWNKDALKKLKNQITTGTSDASAVVSGFNKVLQDVQTEIQRMGTPPPANVADQLTHLVEEQFGAMQQAVLDASAAPGILTSLFQQYYVSAKGVIDAANQGVAQLQAAVMTLPATPADAVALLTKQILGLQTNLTSIWHSAASSRPIPEMADIADTLARLAPTQPQYAMLQPFFTAYNNQLNQLTVALHSGTADLTARLNLIKTDINGLKATFDQTVTDGLNRMASVLRNGYQNADASLVTYMDCFRAELTQIVAGGNNWATRTYNNLIAAAQSGAYATLTGAFQTAVNSISDSTTGPLTLLNNAFNQEMTNLGAINAGVTAALNAFTTSAGGALDDLGAGIQTALANLTAPDDIKRAVLQFRDDQLAALHNLVDNNLALLRNARTDITQYTNQVVSLARAFGEAPAVDNLSFLPSQVGYYLQNAATATQVDLSPLVGALKQAGNVATQAADAAAALNTALNVMHLQVPTASLADRLIPPDLSGMKLSDIFPKFAGIDLSGLFKDINLNEDGSKIQIKHGVDPQSRSAWVQASIGAHLTDVPVFEIGGVSLRLATADFNGQVKLDVSTQGQRQMASGSVLGDWKLLVLGQEVVTLTGTQLNFDSSGKLQFIVQPRNVQLPGVLNFISTYLAPFLGGDNGLSIQVKGLQVNALLNLPIPDMQGLTTGISNLSLNCSFGIGLNDKQQFQLDVGFGLAQPERPFNISVFILGGAGYLNASASYAPGSGSPPSCKVDFGIMASASLAISLGPISGGVYAFMGIQAAFATGGPGLNLTAVLLFRGQVNLAGIISAAVSIELSVSYDGHQLTGRGEFSISISICWCFTLNIDLAISYTLGSSGGQSLAGLIDQRADQILLADLFDPGPNPFSPQQQPQPARSIPADDLQKLIDDYVLMTGGL